MAKTKAKPVVKGAALVREINGRKYVPAHPHEPTAVTWEGEVFRPVEPCEGHVVDNQGTCWHCGETLDLSWWAYYAGEDAPPPSPVVLHGYDY